MPLDNLVSLIRNLSSTASGRALLGRSRGRLGRGGSLDGSGLALAFGLG